MFFETLFSIQIRHCNLNSKWQQTFKNTNSSHVCIKKNIKTISKSKWKISYYCKILFCSCKNIFYNLTFCIKLNLWIKPIQIDFRKMEPFMLIRPEIDFSSDKTKNNHNPSPTIYCLPPLSIRRGLRRDL